MYIIIQREPLKVLTFETKTDLSTYLGIHRNTISNRFAEKEYWESNKGTVYQSNTHYKRVRRGNNDTLEDKIAKRNGEKECKTKKK